MDRSVPEMDSQQASGQVKVTITMTMVMDDDDDDDFNFDIFLKPFETH